MKYVTAIALALIAVPALADIEITGGVSRFHAPPDSVWYQSGFPHSMQMASPTFGIGWASQSWRVGYQYLGATRIDSQAMINEAAWRMHALSCAEGCSQNHGTGRVDALYASWTPHVGHWFGELGVSVVRPDWTVSSEVQLNVPAVAAFCASQPGTFCGKHTFPFKPKIRIEPTIGAGYDFGRVAVAATVMPLRPDGTGERPGYDGPLFKVEARVRF